MEKSICNQPSCIVPYLICVDVYTATKFYEKSFRFNLSGEPYYENKKMIFATMSFRENIIMVGQQGKLGAAEHAPKELHVDPPIALYVYVDDVDKHFAHAVKMGATVIYKPKNKFWGDKVCKLKDNDGHIWGFATKLSTK